MSHLPLPHKTSHKAKMAREWKQRLHLFAVGEEFHRGRGLPRILSGARLLKEYSLVPLMEMQARLVCASTINL